MTSASGPGGQLPSERASDLARLTTGEKRALLKRLMHEREPVQHPPEQKAEGLPLSFAQERLWIIEQISPGTAAYNITLPLRVRGPFHMEAARAALERIIERHEALRSRIRLHAGQPVQQVFPPAPFDLPCRTLPGNLDTEESLHGVLVEEAEKPFDLEHVLPFRAQVIAVGTNDHVLLVTAHHIAFDARSVEIFLAEFRSEYESFLAAKASGIPAPAVQYADYAVWQRSTQQVQAMDADLAFWQEHLSSLEPLHLRNGARAAAQFRGSMRRFTLDATMLRSLRAICAETGCTMFMAGLALYTALLFRYTGQSDIVVGVPVSQRPRQAFEGLIGFFINTLPVRLQFSPSASFHDLLLHCRERVLLSLEHQSVPFERIVDAINPVRDWSGNPVYQTVFSLQARPEVEFPLGNARMHLQEFPVTRVRFDLEWHLWESPDALEMLFFYDVDLFTPAFIDGMAEHAKQLLAAMLAQPAASMLALPMLPETTRDLVLRAWNPSPSPYPRDAGLVQLFEARCAARPEAVALREHAGELSYQSLNERANRLAHHLRDAGVTDGTMVALAGTRNANFVVGLLAILKAGGVYLPLDPDWPAQRCQEIIADAGATLLLGEARQLEALRGTGVATICLDDLEQILSRCAAGNLPARGGGDTPAYVMYTSGSTGRPKGVCVSHRNIIRLVCATNYIAITPDDTLAFASNPAFDAATFEIWGALLNGACIQCIDREELLSPAAFEKILEESRISILFLTTALFNALSQPPFRGFCHLRCLLFGGERCPVDAVRAVLRDQRPQHLLHVYGPTETTTFATSFEVLDIDDSALTVPIGRAIANSTCYVLNHALLPVPPEIEGELYLGGDGVARGYLKRPDLTCECFLPDPFSPVPGARMYRTGDRARWDRDGNLVFVGRADRQVKIRGHRIEPGEIEHRITENQEVRQASVIPVSHGEQDLVLTAFVALHSPAHDAQEQLVARLRNTLPAHMVPERWHFLDSIPLTPNGKVDTAALLMIARDAALPVPETPLSDLESRLAQLWTELLGVHAITREQSFFDLGGNSLQVVRLLLAVHQRFGVAVPPHHFLSAPTLKSLAEILQSLQASLLADNPLEASSPHPAVVPLKPAGTRPPFYFVAPAGGIVTPYYSLAARLPADQPAYGLQDPSLDPHRPLFRRAEELAASHVQALKAFQPAGPYFLGGWSYGGLVAYEIARRLLAQGDEVGLLVLWDAHGSYLWRKGAGGIFARAATKARQTRQVLAEVPEIIRHLFEGLYLRAQFNHERNTNRGARRLRSCLHRVYSWLLFLTAAEAEQVRQNRALSLHKLPTVHRGLRLLFINEKGCRRFKPERFPGDLVLFRATQQPDVLEVATNRTLGWDRHVEGRIHVIDIHGHHTGLFKGESLEQMAPAFVSALREAQDPATRPDRGPAPAS